ncbi:hypothetical protein C1H46_044363 [Malus baccata]|uniref:Uncharacterized protein n=1 Tax=Malus baccata TaxID=106549 RepID=A0A540K798_MALBA|nr:hypothetical protein C1H46_044363 [Malus baccata]
MAATPSLLCLLTLLVGFLVADSKFIAYNTSQGIGACVQNVLDSLVPALLADKNRKFIYVEQATLFLSLSLPAAASASASMSHSSSGGGEIRVTPSRVGFDSLFFGRIDYQDRAKRKIEKSLEFVWRGSKSLSSSAQIFSGAFPENYEPPSGFYFEVNDNSPIVQDDITLFDYNVQDRVNDFVAAAVAQAEQVVATSLAHLVESTSYTGSVDPTTKFQQAINYEPLSFYAIFISCYLTFNCMAGAGSTRSSVQTFQSREESTIEVGQGNVKLTFSTNQGKLTNYVNRRSLVEELVEQSYGFYNGYNGSDDKAPLIPQNAGAYIFRPNGTFLIKPGEKASLTVVRGPVIDEIKVMIGISLFLLPYRRLLLDDSRGVAEALNETVCIDNVCSGLRIQGKFYFRIDPLGEGAKWRRTFGQEIYSPLLLAFSEQDGDNWKNSHVTTFSGVGSSYSLPDNVALITLQIGEDRDLSVMTNVELKQLFPKKKIDLEAVEEMDVTYPPQ